MFEWTKIFNFKDRNSMTYHLRKTNFLHDSTQMIVCLGFSWMALFVWMSVGYWGGDKPFQMNPYPLLALIFSTGAVAVATFTANQRRERGGLYAAMAFVLLGAIVSLAESNPAWMMFAVLFALLVITRFGFLAGEKNAKSKPV